METSSIGNAQCTLHMLDTISKLRQAMDKRFAQGWAAGVVQVHWMAGEVEEHLAAARADNIEQKEGAEKLISARKTLKEAHGTLHYQLLELTASTEGLKRR